MDKTLFRKAMLKKRSGISSSERQKKSLQIQKTALELILSKGGRRILSYSPIFSEVQTDFLNVTLLQEGFEMALPRIQQGKLVFHIISNPDKDLQKGAYNIPEPRDTLPLIPSADIDLAVIPGVAFDYHGLRMGYGKGFYDSFLMDKPHILRVGLAFDCQLVDEMPSERHDQKMHFLITESKTYNFNNFY